MLKPSKLLSSIKENVLKVHFWSCNITFLIKSMLETVYIHIWAPRLLAIKLQVKNIQQNVEYTLNSIRSGCAQLHPCEAMRFSETNSRDVLEQKFTSYSDCWQQLVVCFLCKHDWLRHKWSRNSMVNLLDLVTIN